VLESALKESTKLEESVAVFVAWRLSFASLQKLYLTTVKQSLKRLHRQTFLPKFELSTAVGGLA